MIRDQGEAHEWRLLCLGAEPDEVPQDLLRGATLRHRRVGKLTAHHLAGRLLRRYDDRFLGPVDAFFIPTAHMLTIDPAVPVVLTVHDLFWATATHLMSGRERLWHQVVEPARLYRQAYRLLANSHATAIRIQEILPALADRVVVIPLGIDRVYHLRAPEQIVEEVRNRLGLPDRYILFLSAVEPRKNVARLIEAFQLARRRGLDHELVIAGEVTEASVPELRDAKMDNVSVLGFVRESDKPALYAGATAFTMPSRDEGFGFPPLEALACGTPSLVSDIEVFRETLADAALRRSPDDVEGMADALLQLCGDADIRARLIFNGRPVIDRYDWDRCAAATFREIQGAARHGRQNGD
jgi:glycosyltransferase involved in cell wall biosynthesis